MPTEENKAIVRRFYETYERGDLDACEKLLSPNFRAQEPGFPQLDLAGYRQLGEAFLVAFPDLHHEFEDVIAEGDRVAVRFTFRGTHRGELMGIPPTGKQVTFTGMLVDRIAGGKIAEHWGGFDALGMMQQLGAIPASPQAEPPGEYPSAH